MPILVCAAYVVTELKAFIQTQTAKSSSVILNIYSIYFTLSVTSPAACSTYCHKLVIPHFDCGKCIKRVKVAAASQE